MKKMFAPLLAAMLALCAAPFAFAANEGLYYLVEGCVFANGEGFITRVETATGIGRVEHSGGSDYVISAFNEDGGTVSVTPFDVNFSGVADSGGVASEYSVFTVFIPFDSGIIGFTIYDDGALAMLNTAWLDENIQESVSFFNAEETEDGYFLSWDVALYGPEAYVDEENYARAMEKYSLDYDVVAVSQITGEKNVLAYRAAETELSVPYHWLDPNDTIVFILRSNDGRSTIATMSDEFSTPDGEEQVFGEDEAWFEGGQAVDSAQNGRNGGPGNTLLYIIIGALAAAVIALGVVMIVVVKKKK